MHYVGTLGVFNPNPVFAGHCRGFTEAVLVDQSTGSVHTGLSIAQLDAGGWLAPHVTAYEVGFYILSMIIVGSHLWHGITSAFQSLGLDHPKVTPKLLVAGKVIAVLIAGGFIVIATWAYLTQGGRMRA